MPLPKVALHLKPGLEVTAKVAPNPSAQGLTVRGWKTGQYIILDHPAAKGSNVPVSPDAKCTLRYVSEGKVTSFTTTGITVMRRPLNIFVIEYPQSIHSQISLRKHKRMKCTTPTTIRVLGPGIGDETVSKGMILGMSLGGLLVSSMNDIPLESEVAFDFEFLTGGKVERLRTRMKNKRIDMTSLDFPFICGCEFLEIQAHEQELFQRFFAYCLSQIEKLKALQQKAAAG